MEDRDIISHRSHSRKGRTMKDGFHRCVDYVRISVTNQCNYRCGYCNPHGENERLYELKDEEILEIVRALAENGVKFIKITGGEPLLRKNVFDLIAQIKKIQGIEQVTMTSNGALLSAHLPDLKLLDGINISLDALDEALFQEITGFADSGKILKNIALLAENSVKNIKINCVLLDQWNEKEHLKLAELTREMDITVKFIELMPLGCGRNLPSYSLDALGHVLRENYGNLLPISEKLGNGPANYYKIKGFRGNIGFIAAVSHKFCETCNRIRITSDGFLKTCLQYESGFDLKPFLGKNELAQAIEEAVFHKPEGHSFGNEDIQGAEQGKMSQIGG